jgi:hypothetical protein
MKIPKPTILGRLLTFETAKGTRSCFRAHQILPGEQHLAIYDGVRRNNYCLDCAQEKLKEIENSLQSFQQVKDYFYKMC